MFWLLIILYYKNCPRNITTVRNQANFNAHIVPNLSKAKVSQCLANLFSVKFFFLHTRIWELFTLVKESQSAINSIFICEQTCFSLQLSFSISQPISRGCPPGGLDSSSRIPSTVDSWSLLRSFWRSSLWQHSPPSRCCECGSTRRSRWHCQPSKKFTYKSIIMYIYQSVETKQMSNKSAISKHWKRSPTWSVMQWFSLVI